MDASNYRQVPCAVVLPDGEDDAVAAVAAAREFGVPLVPRGGGTSLAGNATGGGLVLDLSRLNRIHAIDPGARTARVGPGVVLDDLRAAAGEHGLTFGPDPSTHSRCTLGGMIGNNSCGAHSVAWGTTLDNVVELDVLTHDGRRLTVGAGTDVPELRALADENLAVLRTEFGRLGRQVSGYPLHALLPENGRNVAKALVGTEGTCVVVLGATVRLVPVPAARVLLVLGFADDVAAADAVPSILPHDPLTVESLDERIVALWASRNPEPPPELPAGGAWLFVELSDGAAATAIAAELGVPHQVLADPGAQRTLWRLREEGSGISTRMADGSEAWPGWEDTAVPPERLGAYLRELRALLDRHGLRGLTYGHFGEGCIHIRIDWDLVSQDGVAAYRRFIEEGADLVARHGGSLSGEHGDGQVRAELLPRMYSPAALALFERFRAFWDPAGMMNPGMVVRPYRIDENLRFAALKPLPLTTAFSYPHDDGDFAQAARRCVGVAKCRNHSGSVMCPSFQVTGEEKHSTRGRARLLYEMLAGEVVTDGWRSEEVRDALDLCLSCKGCASDCPVNVDMATYKAEFLHHHYRGRRRPASHYSMGWLPLWLRLGSRTPRAANAALASPRMSRALKKIGGIAPRRDLPALAPEPFTRWLRRSTRTRGRPVVLWPDTFTNFFTPEVGVAAVRVLRAAGFEPLLPKGSVCCGLTWVSTGQLSVARRVMRRTLRVLEPAIAAGLPVVALEPSCLSALRGDVPDLTADDRARRLADTSHTLAGFLATHAPQWTPPRIDRTAVTQVHCHQHATLGFTAETRLLADAGITVDRLPAGCCGLAGNFGFEPDHYEVSQALAERALLPAVRAASPDTLVLADGFSCRVQVAQNSDRRAVHLAEALAAGL
ncbi:FAD-binding and (Fe-S)-binding domain-containing protein [Actinophytocola gossypii]|uniref:FAD-binding oxidoreductase n=1 Tax=Actinophytocola gossypii TaxID=2812003 RepID=A0ABT2JFD8_9PSEU|nr:FAD-binding and (Fe-S)-binding domain-containing protein [Actinophytocola gossypii]MCT2586573.1 FAD-binding oxidoreductase [Actinophytocola gossypii]